MSDRRRRDDSTRNLGELDNYFVQQGIGTRAGGMDLAASASMVNRTHRVIRERARSMQARRSTVRSLWIPLAVSGGLLLVIVSAVWSVLDQYEMAELGLQDLSQHLVFMMWCLPLSAAILGVVLFRRTGARTDNGGAR